MCLCSVYFYTILTDCLLFDRCFLHGWNNMDCWIQRTVVYLSPVETGTSRQCEYLLDVTCMYRVWPWYMCLFVGGNMYVQRGPLNMLVFVGDDMYMYVQCRASEICVLLLEVTCMCREGPLWVFVRGNLYVQSTASSRCESLLDIQYRSDLT